MRSGGKPVLAHQQNAPHLIGGQDDRGALMRNDGPVNFKAIAVARDDVLHAEYRGLQNLG